MNAPPTIKIVGGTQADVPRKSIPRSLRLDEILALPAPDYLIRHRLPRAGLVFVYGPPKSGKTFVTLDMCMSLARGEAWHGAETRRTGVLYVAGEGVQGLGIRMRAYIRRHGLKPRTQFRAIPAAIVLHEAVQGIEEEMEAIESEEGWRPGVLVLDTLARTKGDLDENSGDMAAYVAAADHFIARGMLVLVIHHPGKDADKGLRGWSGLLGALDMQILVSKTDDVCVARWTHVKDGQTPPPFTYTLSIVETGESGNFGDAVTSCVVMASDTMPIESRGGRVRPTGDKQHLLHGLIGEMLNASTDLGKAGAAPSRPCVTFDAVAERWRKAVPGEAGERNKLRRVLAALIKMNLLMEKDGWLWAP